MVPRHKDPVGRSDDLSESVLNSGRVFEPIDLFTENDGQRPNFSSENHTRPVLHSKRTHTLAKRQQQIRCLQLVYLPIIPIHHRTVHTAVRLFYSNREQKLSCSSNSNSNMARQVPGASPGRRVYVQHMHTLQHRRPAASIFLSFQHSPHVFVRGKFLHYNILLRIAE